MNAERTTLAPKRVDLEDVEAAFTEIRCGGDRAAGRGARQPITRACMSNLIVYCDSSEQADALPHEFAAIARRHPARILLLVGGAVGQQAGIEATVSANISETVGGPQISSEQVRINAREEAIERLPSAARALLIGDLPTALWWSSTRTPSSSGALFHELAAMADSILYDSRGWPDPLQGMIDMANWTLDPENRKQVTDLAWVRLRHARGLLAETLAPDLHPAALERIEAIEIEHGPHALPMVWLFVGWLAHCLDWSPGPGRLASKTDHELFFQQGSARDTSGRTQRDREDDRIRIHIVRDDEGPPLMRHVVIRCRAEDDLPATTVEFEALEQDRLAVRTRGAWENECVVSVHDDPRAAMLAWQLANRADQPLFRDVLDIGRRMTSQLLR